MRVRTMLGSGTAANASVISRNTTGAMNTATAGDAGTVETQKIADTLIRDAFNRDTEFRQYRYQPSGRPKTTSSGRTYLKQSQLTGWRPDQPGSGSRCAKYQG